MKKLLRSLLVSLLVFTGAAAAQAPEQRGPFPQAQLDAMLAPIALYPDSLLSQVLMAASYPGDVADAARWSRENPGLRGAEAVRAVQEAPWDPSVVSLVAFPQILAMMAERPQWVEDLGAAFVGQSREVMDTVQQLRARADAAGTLQGNDQMLVERRGQDYLIEPASAETVHVPYYDPRYAYGDWWWPNTPPVYWNAWPGYNFAFGYGGLGWGYGINVGPGFWFSALDWPRRYVRYGHHRPWYHHGHYRNGDRWRHDGNRRWAGHDGRWRDGSRDGRWRDGNRDARWRDGNQDGRWRDGNRDGRRDADRDRGTRSQVTRPVAPAYSSNPGVTRARPTYRNEREPRTEPRIEQRLDATAVQRSHSPGTPAMQQRAAAPAPVQRSSAPVQRSAPAPAQQQRSAPAERSERPARSERAERSAPERSRESSSNPAERGSRSMQR